MSLALSDKEREVLNRLALGEKRKEIAEALDIAEVTVNQRVYAAQKRNDSRTTYQLIAQYAVDSLQRGGETDT